MSPLFALTVATFAVGLGELAIAGILPPLAGDLRVTIPVAGQLVTAYALVFALTTPVLAAVFGGARRKRGLTTGLIVVALANVLAAFAPSYLPLLCARLLAAAGSALVSPLALSLIDDVVPPARRGRAQGIVFAGFSVAMTLGLPLGALIANAFGWRAVFGVIAVVCALAAVAAAALRVPEVAHTPLRWSVVRASLTPAVIRLLAISFFCLVAQYVVFPYLRPYIADLGYTDIRTSALLLFVLGFFGIAGNLCGGFALERFGARGAILAMLGANVVIYLVLRFVHGPPLVTVALFAGWAVSSWAYSPSVNHALAEAGGDQRDVALALNMTAFNLGVAGGSALGGAVIALGSIADIVVAGAVMLVIALIIAVGLPRQSPPPIARYSG